MLALTLSRRIAALDADGLRSLIQSARETIEAAGLDAAALDDTANGEAAGEQVGATHAAPAHKPHLRPAPAPVAGCARAAPGAPCPTGQAAPCNVGGIRSVALYWECVLLISPSLPVKTRYDE